MLHRSTRSFLSLLVMLCSAPAYATEVDEITIGVETIGHWPTELPPLAADTLALSQLQPVLHETDLVWGVGVSSLYSSFVMRLGYRFSAGGLPAGSKIGSSAATRYDLRGVPILVGVRSTFPRSRVRALLGVEAGGTVESFSYGVDRGDPETSGLVWAWELRGLAGLHVDLFDWLAMRLFAEGRLATDVAPVHGPAFDASGVGIGLGAVISLGPDFKPRVTPQTDTENGGDLKQYDNVGASRLDRAFEVIRAADEAVRKHNAIEAEALYRKGVGMLPRDSETRRNVEAPVRVDWARALIEIGRQKEARTVLQQALEIDPANRAANELLHSVGGANAEADDSSPWSREVP